MNNMTEKAIELQKSIIRQDLRIKKLKEQIKAKDKELKSIKDHCVACGATEFICGHNKRW